MNLKNKSATIYRRLISPFPHFISSSSFLPHYFSPLNKTLISAMSTTAGSESEPISTVDPSPTPQIAESATVDSVQDDDDVKYGFKRDEMYKESFPKAADRYDRHVFLSYKSALSWPARVEDVKYDPLTSKFALALKNRKNEIQKKTRFTVIEGGGVEADGDVFIFPDMIKYKNLTHEAVDEFVEDVLVKETTSATLGSPDKLTGFHLFVCAHATRDKRCGVCGPILIDKLNEEIGVRGLEERVFVSPCSHIGGHKYAGNVIVFGPSSDGKVMGHWYGYVTPDDVPLLLDQHIEKGEIIERLWRGEVCNPDEGKQESPKPQESDSVPYANGINLESGEEFQESITRGNMQNGGSCCQGANGFTCCQDEKVELVTKDAEAKPSKSSSVCARGVDKVSSWFGKLEQEDVLVGVAILGAAATVAVGYSIYRRSG